MIATCKTVISRKDGRIISSEVVNVREGEIDLAPIAKMIYQDMKENIGYSVDSESTVDLWKVQK